jgi:hypothetical protein
MKVFLLIVAAATLGARKQATESTGTPIPRVAVYSPHGEEESLRLQDHNSPVRFRNIWIRRLGHYDQDQTRIDS